MNATNKESPTKFLWPKEYVLVADVFLKINQRFTNDTLWVSSAPEISMQ